MLSNEQLEMLYDRAFPFLRCDESEEVKQEIMFFIQSAVIYINNSLDSPLTFKGEYKELEILAVCFLTAHYYENRSIYQTAGRTTNDVPYTMDSFLFQLNYARGDPDESGEFKS